MPAFDQAVFMKVFPKFSGSRARLRAPLLSLLAWTFYPANPEPALGRSSSRSWRSTLKTPPLSPIFIRDAPFKTVAARAAQMLITLESEGFVSFG